MSFVADYAYQIDTDFDIAYSITKKINNRIEEAIMVYVSDLSLYEIDSDNLELIRKDSYDFSGYELFIYNKKRNQTTKLIEIDYHEFLNDTKMSVGHVIEVYRNLLEYMGDKPCIEEGKLTSIMIKFIETGEISHSDEVFVTATDNRIMLANCAKADEEDKPSIRQRIKDLFS